MVLTGIPGSCLPHVKPIVGLDKVGHLLMYAAFAFLCLWGYRKQFISNGQAYQKKALLLAVVISIFYGGLTEIMQETITFLHRSGDWRDLIADSIGTGIGVLVFYLFFRRKK